ncbi:hypothetical protein MTO96_034729 [Rhipicephalus appendiculatus]
MKTARKKKCYADLSDRQKRRRVNEVFSTSAGIDADDTAQDALRGKVVFPKTNAALRSDLDFAEKSCPEHHVSNTPLSVLPFGLVSGFPYEYMHLVCLGVQKKLIQLWKGERRSTFRLRHDQISELSTKLTSVGLYVCREFARRPQSLQDLGAWKATEYRQFLLYSGPALLQGYLDRKRYEHFLVLHVAITILAHPQLCTELNDYARRLLTFFVHTFIDIYGIENVTYNVHGLVHLADDVRLFGPLDAFSAFAAESFMGRLKALIRPGDERILKELERIRQQNEQIIQMLTDMAPRFTDQLGNFTFPLSTQEDVSSLEEQLSSNMELRRELFALEAGASGAQSSSRRRSRGHTTRCERRHIAAEEIYLC